MSVHVDHPGDPEEYTDPPGPQQEHASIGELLGRVSTDLSTLMRQEVALAKAEARATAVSAGRGAGMLAGAGLAAFFVLMFGSVAIWWSVGDLLGRGWSALIVTGGWLVVAAVLALAGRTALQQVRGVPQTTETLKKVPNAVKGHEEENR